MDLIVLYSRLHLGILQAIFGRQSTEIRGALPSLGSHERLFAGEFGTIILLTGVSFWTRQGWDSRAIGATTYTYSSIKAPVFVTLWRVSGGM